MTATPTLLIDADTPAYVACQSSEIEVDHGDWHMVASNFPLVKQKFKSTLDLWQAEFNTTKVVLYFTGRSNFRKEVDPEYKGHRLKRKPLGYYKLLEWCKDHYHCKIIEGLEADDLLGLDAHLATDPIVLISADKDLRQISCPQWNGSEHCHPTVEEGDRFFYQQVLTGDPVDGYKGCPGIGAVKAKAILDKAPPEAWWLAVMQAYKKAGLTEADALQNARLARILRPGEFNYDTQKPILWTPPQI